MCSVPKEKTKNKPKHETNQNDHVQTSIEYWKSKYPRFFDKTVRIKLNRMKLCSDINKKSDIKQKRRHCDSDHIRITRSRNKLNTDVEWVRITQKIYKNDLAKVDTLDVIKKEVHLKLFPRINYDSLNSEGLNGRLNRRPSPKPLDPNIIR